MVKIKPLYIIWFRYIKIMRCLTYNKSIVNLKLCRGLTLVSSVKLVWSLAVNCKCKCDFSWSVEEVYVGIKEYDWLEYLTSARNSNLSLITYDYARFLPVNATETTQRNCSRSIEPSVRGESRKVETLTVPSINVYFRWMRTYYWRKKEAESVQNVRTLMKLGEHWFSFDAFKN